MSGEAFSDEQKQYLEGFMAGSALSRSLPVLPTFAATLGLPAEKKLHGADDDAPAGCGDLHRQAQDRFLAEGKKLTPEEIAKRKKDGLDLWDEVMQHARDGRFPKGTDVFLFKFQGLFYVAPAQDSFMCRLRFPGGIVSSAQLRGIADLAAELGGGYADVTTRANLQIREVGPRNTIPLLERLHELGIINRGAGADNIRNVTGCPTAGIDAQELIDTRPLTRAMHHYILNHRELYGLPRKFNIAFDGGGRISALDDTNDIGFSAVRVPAGASVEAGVYFRLTLGGITGHKDFARDTGIVLKPEECVEVAAAVVRAFIEHGDRTDRRKARLKYVLDRMGFDAFVREAEKHLSQSKLRRLPLSECETRPPVDKHGHVGVYPQKQPGLSYIGLVLPVGRMYSQQMKAVAGLADRHGSGTIRLTVWQNLLISDIPDEHIPTVQRELKAIGFSCSATGVRAGLVACTGSAGCKYAAADTKSHALALADYLDARLHLDQPINIHFTGCHHSCAQHYIGDIGLLATKVTVGEETLEGYHVYIGGGYGAEQAIGRELYREVTATELLPLIERMLRSYLENRRDERETFRSFVTRHSTPDLKATFEQKALVA